MKKCSISNKQQFGNAYKSLAKMDGGGSGIIDRSRLILLTPNIIFFGNFVCVGGKQFHVEGQHLNR